MTEDDEAVLAQASKLATEQGMNVWPEQELVRLAEGALIDCVAALSCLPAKARVPLAKELTERLAAVTSPA